MKRRTGHVRADNLLIKVASFTLQTGLITAAWGVTSLISFATLNNGTSQLLIMTQAGLYSNILLLALNCRIGPVDEGDITTVSTPSQKSEVLISAVTFMDMGLKSDVAVESGQRRAISSGNTIVLDISPQSKPEGTSTCSS